VSSHLHRDAFGNSGAHQVADGCSPKVMRNAAGTARFLARLFPRLRESNDPLALDLFAAALEHPRTDHVFGSEPIVFGLLSLQELLQGVGEGESTPFVVLRRMRVQTNDACLEIDVASLQP
jgi:hypothetical protein